MKTTLMIFCFFCVLIQSIIAQLPTSSYSFKSDSTHLNTGIKYQYKPFNYPLTGTTDFSNYPLTSAQIKKQEKNNKFYNRTINTITNRNQKGAIVNLISFSGWELERYKPQP